MGLFPKDENFYHLFTQQVELICEMSQLFHDLVHHYEGVEEKVKEISRVERKGDALYHEITHKVHTTFVTPIDREDIHQLADQLDDILDYIQAAASRMHLFRVEEPLPGLRAMADLVPQCAEVLKQGIGLLPKMTDMTELRKKMHSLESQGDHLNRDAMTSLFNTCKTVEDVIQLIKWREIIDTTESGIDRFEDVFDVLENIVIKHG